MVRTLLVAALISFALTGQTQAQAPNVKIQIASDPPQNLRPMVTMTPDGVGDGVTKLNNWLAEERIKYAATREAYTAQIRATPYTLGAPLAPPEPVISGFFIAPSAPFFSPGSIFFGTVRSSGNNEMSFAEGKSACAIQDPLNNVIDASTLAYLGPRWDPAWKDLSVSMGARFSSAPPADVKDDIVWEQKPTGQTFGRYYPNRALDREKSGRVVLSCIISGDYTPTCVPLMETPTGWDFGKSAVRISTAFKAAPTLKTGEPSSGRCVSLPIVFQVG